MSLSSELEQNSSKSARDNAPNSSKWKDFPPPVVASMAGSGLLSRSPSLVLCFARSSKRTAMALKVSLNASSRPTHLKLDLLLDNYKHLSRMTTGVGLYCVPLCVLWGQLDSSSTLPGKQDY
jgi:hypothetical protein